MVAGFPELFFFSTSLKSVQIRGAGLYPRLDAHWHTSFSVCGARGKEYCRDTLSA